MEWRILAGPVAEYEARGIGYAQGARSLTVNLSAIGEAEKEKSERRKGKHISTKPRVGANPVSGILTDGFRQALASRLLLSPSRTSTL